MTHLLRNLLTRLYAPLVVALPLLVVVLMAA